MLLKLKKHVPNILTVSRLPLAALIGWLIFSDYLQWALVPLIVSLATDILDGHLARRWGVESRFGYVADHVVDKISIIPYGYLFWNLIPRELFFLLSASKLSVLVVSVWIFFWKIRVSWPNIYGRLAFGFVAGSAGVLMLGHGLSVWPIFYGLAIGVLAAALILRLIGFWELRSNLVQVDE